MSITSSNISNMLCDYNIHMSDIINCSESKLMKIACTGFNAIPNEQWKCNILLELIYCLFVFSNGGLS